MTTLPPALTTVSLRSVRLRARAPRIALLTLVAILCCAGLKAIVRGAPAPAAAPPLAAPAADLGAETFAEGFVRTYLTWSPDDLQSRDQALARYLPAALGSDGGLRPVDGVAEEVAWTAVVRSSRDAVTVEAQTRTTYPKAEGDTGAVRNRLETLYLDVPVSRDRKGFLYIKDYPAVVGAPPATRSAQPPVFEPVDDERLSAVVGRALTNYLAGARDNLLADLTPDAVVSLPPQRLRVTGVGEVDWVRPGRRVTVQLEAEGPSGAWTLRYALDVRRTDRWYVQSLQVDPTSKGAR
jgi:hypothetical protein